MRQETMESWIRGPTRNESTSQPEEGVRHPLRFALGTLANPTIFGWTAAMVAGMALFLLCLSIAGLEGGHVGWVVGSSPGMSAIVASGSLTSRILGGGLIAVGVILSNFLSYPTPVVGGLLAGLIVAFLEFASGANGWRQRGRSWNALAWLAIGLVVGSLAPLMIDGFRNMEL